SGNRKRAQRTQRFRKGRKRKPLKVFLASFRSFAPFAFGCSCQEFTMVLSSLLRLLPAVSLATLLAVPASASAQVSVRVIISGGFSGPYEQLIPEFQRSTGIQVVTGSGSSQGTGPQTIAAQLERGVPADVVILSREGLSELM